MKNFQCKKCSSHLISYSNPNVSHCPSGVGHHHQWTDLGEVGDQKYQCKKCKLLVKSKNIPHVLNCPSSVGHQHQWTKI